MTRRGFLFATPLLALAQAKSVRLGGPIFLKSDDPRELAREHRRLGYTAAYCPNGNPSEIRKAFAAEDVVIAEVGAWRNMLDPDPGKRRDNLRYVADRLHFADACGARNCVDIAGSLNPDLWYGPNPKNLSKEFFDATVENCRKLIDEVKPTNTKFSIEMMPWSLPDGPDSYVKLIRAVDRKAFGVHLDVCNVINSPDRFYRNAEVIHECFEKLRPWILSLPRQGSGMGDEGRIQRALSGNGPRPRPDRLRDVFEGTDHRRRPVDAGAFEVGGRIRRSARRTYRKVAQASGVKIN